MTNNALSGSGLVEAIAQDLWPSASADNDRWWRACHELRVAARALSLAGLGTERDELFDMAGLALSRATLAPYFTRLPGVLKPLQWAAHPGRAAGGQSYDE